MYGDEGFAITAAFAAAGVRAAVVVVAIASKIVEAVVAMISLRDTAAVVASNI